MEPKALPKRVTPRSTTKPLTRSVVMRPPTRDSASSTNGSSPRSFKRTAAPSPAMPPPMTITSASLLWPLIKRSLAPRPGKEIDSLRAARVLHIDETLAKEFVPILALGNVMNDRAKDDVVMRVPTVFEEQDFSARLQDADGFAKEFFARATRRNFVDAEAKTNGVTGSIRQGNRETICLGRNNSRIASGRKLQIADILYGFFRRLSFLVPAVHGLDGSFRQNVRKQKSVAIRSNMQIRHGRSALHAAELHKAADVEHTGMAVHAIQTEKRIGKKEQADFSERHGCPKRQIVMKKNSNDSEGDTNSEKLLRDSPIVAAADVDGASPVPPCGRPLRRYGCRVPVCERLLCFRHCSSSDWKLEIRELEIRRCGQDGAQHAAPLPTGFTQDLQHLSLKRLDKGANKGRVGQLNGLRQEIKDAVHELMRFPLPVRFVVNKEKNHPEMHEPERGGENFLHLLADICLNDRFVEDGHALRALKLSAFTENRERVLWISGVPKERSEEAAVVLQDFQLGMEHHAEAFAKAGLPFPLFTR